MSQFREVFLDLVGRALYPFVMEFEIPVYARVDTRGLLCPLPVLRARKRLISMEKGQVLAMVADDPAAMIDVPHFCSEQGYTLISQRENGVDLWFLIRK